MRALPVLEVLLDRVVASELERVVEERPDRDAARCSRGRTWPRPVDVAGVDGPRRPGIASGTRAVEAARALGVVRASARRTPGAAATARGWWRARSPCRRAHDVETRRAFRLKPHRVRVRVSSARARASGGRGYDMRGASSRGGLVARMVPADAALVDQMFTTRQRASARSSVAGRRRPPGLARVRAASLAAAASSALSRPRARPPRRPPAVAPMSSAARRRGASQPRVGAARVDEVAHALEHSRGARGRGSASSAERGSRCSATIAEVRRVPSSSQRSVAAPTGRGRHGSRGSGCVTRGGAAARDAATSRPKSAARRPRQRRRRPPQGPQAHERVVDALRQEGRAARENPSADEGRGARPARRSRMPRRRCAAARPRTRRS